LVSTPTNQKNKFPQIHVVLQIQPKIIVRVIEAKDLPKTDVFGKSDPYTVVNFGTDISIKGTIQMKTLNPKWNDKFRILIKKSQQKYNVELSLFDYDKGKKDDFVGSTNFDLVKLLKEPKLQEDIWLDVTNPKKTTQKSW